MPVGLVDVFLACECGYKDQEGRFRGVEVCQQLVHHLERIGGSDKEICPTRTTCKQSSFLIMVFASDILLGSSMVHKNPQVIYSSRHNIPTTCTQDFLESIFIYIEHTFIQFIMKEIQHVFPMPGSIEKALLRSAEIPSDAEGIRAE